MSPFTVEIISYLVTLMFGVMNTEVWGLLLDRLLLDRLLLDSETSEVSSSGKQKTGKCENTFLLIGIFYIPILLYRLVETQTVCKTWTLLVGKISLQKAIISVSKTKEEMCWMVCTKQEITVFLDNSFKSKATNPLL